MKQFSLFLNILLVAAVGVLFYLHFAGSKKTETKTGTPFSPQNTSAKDSCAKGHLIGYVVLDSIYDNVEFIKAKNKEIENQQNDEANKLQNEAAKLENEKNEFLKKGNAITQAEYENFQKTYVDNQRSLEIKRQNAMQTLTTARTQATESIQKDIRTFLDAYNSDRRYSYIFAYGTGFEYMLYKDSTHNITSEVIKGLNEYFSKKGK